jgi:16S rRNA (guanine966-N2)-methyltransferase
MRVIAGTLKGRRLQAPAAGDRSIRPTADRAREALFSILQGWPQGPFLDLFGGTGAVALEAWSRGYCPVWCVEKDPRALALARENLRGTQVEVRPADVLRLPADAFAGLAVAFADPPYPDAVEAFGRIAPQLRRWMATEGLVVWETAAGDTLEAPEGWTALPSRKYGAARFHFFTAG